MALLDLQGFAETADWLNESGISAAFRAKGPVEAVSELTQGESATVKVRAFSTHHYRLAPWQDLFRGSGWCSRSFCFSELTATAIVAFGRTKLSM